MTQADSSDATTPVVVLHPSASFRRGLGDALRDRSLTLTAAPPDLPIWLNGDSRRVLVIGHGTEANMIPRCGDSTTVVVLVGDLDAGTYRRALAIGAHGLANVDADPETIATVVQASVTGEIVLPVEIARRLAGRPPPSDLVLSPEERGLLQRLSDGATVVERSVRRRLQNIYIRLGVPGRAAALKRASQLGLVE